MFDAKALWESKKTCMVQTPNDVYDLTKTRLQMDRAGDKSRVRGKWIFYCNNCNKILGIGSLTHLERMSVNNIQSLLVTVLTNRCLQLEYICRCMR